MNKSSTLINNISDLFINEKFDCDSAIKNHTQMADKREIQAGKFRIKNQYAMASMYQDSHNLHDQAAKHFKKYATTCVKDHLVRGKTASKKADAYDEENKL